MPESVQAKMEKSFNADLSNVEIYEGDAASSIGAHAYAAGNIIQFARGEYNPESAAGQKLLGHELAHVMQQSQGRVQPTIQAKGLSVNYNQSLENEAEQMGAKAAQGDSVGFSGAKNKVAKSSFHSPGAAVVQGNWWEHMKKNWSDSTGAVGLGSGLVSGLYHGVKSGVDTTRDFYNYWTGPDSPNCTPTCFDEENQAPQNNAPGWGTKIGGGLMGGTLGIGTGLLSMGINGATGLVSGGLNVAKSYWNKGGEVLPDTRQRILDSQGEQEDLLPIWQPNFEDAFSRRANRTLGQEALQSLYPAYGGLELAYKVGNQTLTDMQPQPWDSFEHGLHNVGAYGSALESGLLTGATSVPLGMLGTLGYGAHKTLTTVSDYIAPGPIASMTGPFNLFSTLASTPENFGNLTDLSSIGRGGLSADTIGAMAQLYSGGAGLILGPDLPARVNGGLNLLQGGMFTATDMVTGSVLPTNTTSQGGSYFAEMLGNSTGLHASSEAATGMGYGLNSLYALVYGGKAVNSYRQMRALDSVLDPMSIPSNGPLTGLTPEQHLTKDVASYAKKNAKANFSHNSLASLASLMSITGTAVGGPWGWMLGLISGTLGLGLGATKLWNWVQEYIGVRDDTLEERRKLAKRMADVLSSTAWAALDPNMQNLATIFGIDQNDCNQGAGSVHELSLKIYNEMARW